jgi:hypothetical protein
MLYKNDGHDRGEIVKRYLVEEIEPYIPISLDTLVVGHAVPFEVFTDDGELKKSLFDKGFIFNVFAKEIIHHQGLTQFYIKVANNLIFNEYLSHAEKLSRMVKDDSALFIDYSEYKREHTYIDKTLLSPLVDIDFQIGGMRYPIYGGIPLMSNHLPEQMLDFLMGLNADIVIKTKEVWRYDNYLHRVIDAEHGL